jgi:hypothetical protein
MGERGGKAGVKARAGKARGKVVAKAKERGKAVALKFVALVTLKIPRFSSG